MAWRVSRTACRTDMGPEEGNAPTVPQTQARPFPPSLKLFADLLGFFFAIPEGPPR